MTSSSSCTCTDGIHTECTCTESSKKILPFSPRALLMSFTAFILLFSLQKASLAQTVEEKKKEWLNELIRLQEQPASRDDFVSYHDKTWVDWVERTGALPPDFDALPSLPFLPDPLIMDEGGENIPVQTPAQWDKKREWIQEHVKHILSGTFPAPPDQLTAHVLEERVENGVTVELIELRFGDDERAKLTLELFTPPGEGPFPVFMTQWNHRGWAQIAVRRGYMGLIYAGADSRDDTREYLSLYPDHDWSTLMTRAWGAHRAVDFLYTLDTVDRDKIAITGHSRNGKQSVFAAAFDDRITAVISSSGGTGGEIPYRYTDDRHSNESIDYLVSRRTHWLHPRLRFYWGREHKMPIDQNSLLSLIAPNSLLLSTSIREGKAGGAPWAIEQSYHAVKEVYEFLGVPEKVGLRNRDGTHSVEARDIEAYVDWLDIQFDRNPEGEWENQRYYDYSFENWKERSGEQIDPDSFPESAGRPLLVTSDDTPIQTVEEWEERRDQIRNNTQWLLGEEPPGIAANPIRQLRRSRQDYINSFINRPDPEQAEVRYIAPYGALGDYQHASLYYPVDEQQEMKTDENGKLPVVIWLHRFSDTGFNAVELNDLFDEITSRGIAVLAMDLLGFGQRIEEGAFFYDRYPNWSKLGKMVNDLRAAVDALEDLDFVDTDRTYIGGFALGGTAALFAAALDDRIDGVALSGAFTPLRTAGEDVEGIYALSHLHGLIPRLGFFAGHEENLPIDYPEILAAIAPRPLLVISPKLDRHADVHLVEQTLQEVETVYDLYGKSARLRHDTPQEFNGFSQAQKREVAEWLETLARP